MKEQNCVGKDKELEKSAEVLFSDETRFVLIVQTEDKVFDDGGPNVTLIPVCGRPTVGAVRA